jgi:hypothetical protein
MPKGNRLFFRRLVTLALAVTCLKVAQADVNSDGAMLSGSFGESWTGGALSVPGVATAHLEGAFDERHKEVNSDGAILNGAPDATSTPTPSQTPPPSPTSTVTATATRTRTATPTATGSQLPLNPPRLIQLLTDFHTNGIDQDVLLERSQTWHDPE